MAKNALRGLLFGLPLAVGVSLYMTQVDQPLNASSIINYLEKSKPVPIESIEKPIEQKISGNDNSNCDSLENIINITKLPKKLTSVADKIQLTLSKSEMSLFKPEGHFYVDTQAYDSIIVEKTNYWNNYFKLSGNDKLDPNLVKAMILQESSGNPDAYARDPMQIGNQGDYALDVLASGDELTYRYTTEKFRENLESIGYTPQGKYGFNYSKSKMNPETSIDAGILWLIHKGNVYDETGNIIARRDWDKALDRYNGGGIQNYSDKVHEYLES